MGLLEQARMTFEDALESCKVALGEQHPTTVLAAAGFATVLREYVAGGKKGQRAFCEAAHNVRPHMHLLGGQMMAAECKRAPNPYGQLSCRLASRLCVLLLGRENPESMASHPDVLRAEALLTDALKTLEHSQGDDAEDSLAIATVANNLAFHFKHIGDVERQSDAEHLYQRAITARSRLLGPTHPDTIAARHNLAGLFFTYPIYIYP